MTRWLNFLSWSMLAFAPPMPHALVAHRMSVGELIVREAVRQGLPSHIAVDRAWAESKMVPTARHRNFDGSVDAGVMQINSRYTPGVQSMTVEQNIREGVRILNMFYRRCGGEERCTHQAYRTGRVHRR